MSLLPDLADAIVHPRGEVVIGLGGSDHDYSAALLRGTDIRVAIESERISRVKYGAPPWYEDPVHRAISYCLEADGLRESDVARFVSSDLLPYRTQLAWDIKTYGHHLCHAASAIMLLPPTTRACVLVYDGTGSPRPIPDTTGGRTLGTLACETFSFFDYHGGHLTFLGGTRGQRIVEWQWALNGTTNSIGELYGLVTELIGFDRKESGKTMGLAAWGEPRFLEPFLDRVTFGANLDEVFSFDPFDDTLQRILEQSLAKERHSFRVRADLAATAQALLNRCLCHCYQLADDRAFDVFCIAGGCALSTVANGELATRMDAERRLVIPPYASDSGIGFGALWLDARDRSEDPVQLTLRGKPLAPAIARPGRTYSASRAHRAAGRELARLAHDPAVDGPEALARVIADGAVIAVFNGPSEIGPRALGGRSIIADPREVTLKERINRDIKHREPFRPLAPMVLAEHFDTYFFPPASANAFMLVNTQARACCREVAPATLHIDGTARTQVVGPDDDPFVIALLRAFHAITGLPILLNTSFNRRGEPIVETPEEATAAFLEMKLDGLWLDEFFVYPADSASRQR